MPRMIDTELKTRITCVSQLPLGIVRSHRTGLLTWDPAVTFPLGAVVFDSRWFVPHSCGAVADFHRASRTSRDRFVPSCRTAHELLRTIPAHDHAVTVCGRCLTTSGHPATNNKTS